MEEIIEYYNKLANNYDLDRFENSYGKFIDKQQRRILKRLLTNVNERVLDLACGSGRFLSFADIGIDGSSEMVKIANQKYPEIQIINANADETGLKDNSIDTIICFHLFMHLDKEKMHIIFIECERILSKNGRLIFDIPSAKRRKLIKYKRINWHGGYSLTLDEIKKYFPQFKIRRSFGIMILPIHRFPNYFRKYLFKIDEFLSNSILKEYSSYLTIELIKL